MSSHLTVQSKRPAEESSSGCSNVTVKDSGASSLLSSVRVTQKTAPQCTLVNNDGHTSRVGSSDPRSQTMDKDRCKDYSDKPINIQEDAHSQTHSNIFPSQEQTSDQTIIPGLGDFDLAVSDKPESPPTYSRLIHSAVNILRQFGLGKDDLDKLLSYPDDEINLDSLPLILEKIHADKLNGLTSSDQSKTKPPQNKDAEDSDSCRELSRAKIMDNKQSFQSKAVAFRHGGENSRCIGERLEMKNATSDCANAELMLRNRSVATCRKEAVHKLAEQEQQSEFGSESGHQPNPCILLQTVQPAIVTDKKQDSHMAVVWQQEEPANPKSPQCEQPEHKLQNHQSNTEVYMQPHLPPEQQQQEVYQDLQELQKISISQEQLPQNVDYDMLSLDEGVLESESLVYCISTVSNTRRESKYDPNTSQLKVTVTLPVETKISLSAEEYQTKGVMVPDPESCEFISKRDEDMNVKPPPSERSQLNHASPDSPSSHRSPHSLESKKRRSDPLPSSSHSTSREPGSPDKQNPGWSRGKEDRTGKPKARSRGSPQKQGATPRHGSAGTKEKQRSRSCSRSPPTSRHRSVAGPVETSTRRATSPQRVHDTQPSIASSRKPRSMNKERPRLSSLSSETKVVPKKIESSDLRAKMCAEQLAESVLELPDVQALSSKCDIDAVVKSVTPAVVAEWYNFINTSSSPNAGAEKDEVLSSPLPSSHCSDPLIAAVEKNDSCDQSSTGENSAAPETQSSTVVHKNSVQENRSESPKCPSPGTSSSPSPSHREVMDLSPTWSNFCLRFQKPILELKPIMSPKTDANKHSSPTMVTLCGLLPFITRDDVVSAVGEVGKTKSVILIRARQEAVVCFEREEDAKKLKPFEIKGCKITIKPKEMTVEDKKNFPEKRPLHVLAESEEQETGNKSQPIKSTVIKTTFPSGASLAPEPQKSEREMAPSSDSPPETTEINSQQSQDGSFKNHSVDSLKPGPSSRAKPATPEPALTNVPTEKHAGNVTASPSQSALDCVDVNTSHSQSRVDHQEPKSESTQLNTGHLSENAKTVDMKGGLPGPDKLGTVPEPPAQMLNTCLSKTVNEHSDVCKPPSEKVEKEQARPPSPPAETVTLVEASIAQNGCSDADLQSKTVSGVNKQLQDNRPECTGPQSKPGQGGLLLKAETSKTSKSVGPVPAAKTETTPKSSSASLPPTIVKQADTSNKCLPLNEPKHPSVNEIARPTVSGVSKQLQGNKPEGTGPQSKPGQGGSLLKAETTKTSKSGPVPAAKTETTPKSSSASLPPTIVKQADTSNKCLSLNEPKYSSVNEIARPTVTGPAIRVQHPQCKPSTPLQQKKSQVQSASKPKQEMTNLTTGLVKPQPTATLPVKQSVMPDSFQSRNVWECFHLIAFQKKLEISCIRNLPHLSKEKFIELGKRHLLITNLPKYSNGCYTATDLLNLFKGVQRPSINGFYIMTEARMAVVIFQYAKTLYDVISSPLSLKGNKLNLQVLSDDTIGSSPLMFLKCILMQVHHTRVPVGSKTVYFPNISQTKIRELRETLKSNNTVLYFLPLLSKLFVEFKTHEDSDKFGLWLHQQNQSFGPGIRRLQLTKYSLDASAKESRIPKGCSPPFRLTLSSSPFIFITVTPTFVTPEYITVDETADIERAVRDGAKFRTVMLTGLPVKGYTFKDILERVEVHFPKESHPLLIHKVVVLPLQRRAFVHFDDWTACYDFARSHLKTPIRVKGVKLFVHFVIDDLFSPCNEENMYTSMMKLSNVPVRDPESLTERLLYVWISEFTEEVFESVLKSVTLMGPFVTILPLVNRICFEMANSSDAHKKSKSLPSQQFSMNPVQRIESLLTLKERLWNCKEAQEQGTPPPALKEETQCSPKSDLPNQVSLQHASDQTAQSDVKAEASNPETNAAPIMEERTAENAEKVERGTSIPESPNVVRNVTTATADKSECKPSTQVHVKETSDGEKKETTESSKSLPEEKSDTKCTVISIALKHSTLKSAESAKKTNGVLAVASSLLGEDSEHKGLQLLHQDLEEMDHKLECTTTGLCSTEKNNCSNVSRGLTVNSGGTSPDQDGKVSDTVPEMSHDSSPENIQSVEHEVKMLKAKTSTTCDSIETVIKGQSLQHQEKQDQGKTASGSLGEDLTSGRMMITRSGAKKRGNDSTNERLNEQTVTATNGPVATRSRSLGKKEVASKLPVNPTTDNSLPMKRKRGRPKTVSTNQSNSTVQQEAKVETTEVKDADENPNEDQQKGRRKRRKNKEVQLFAETFEDTKTDAINESSSDQPMDESSSSVTTPGHFMEGEAHIVEVKDKTFLTVDESKEKNEATERKSSEKKGDLRAGDMGAKAKPMQEEKASPVQSLQIPKKDGDRKARTSQATKRQYKDIQDKTKLQSQAESKKFCPPPSSDAAIQLPKFNPNKPLGQEFIQPRTGYCCSLCAMFYIKEKTALEDHCRTQKHYDNLKAYYHKIQLLQSSGKSSKSTSDGNS